MDKNLTSEMAKPNSFWGNIKIPRCSVFDLKVMIFEKRNYEDCEKYEIISIRKVNIISHKLNIDLNLLIKLHMATPYSVQEYLCITPH